MRVTGTGERPGFSYSVTIDTDYDVPVLEFFDEDGRITGELAFDTAAEADAAEWLLAQDIGGNA
jgi:hypothetical protein